MVNWRASFQSAVPRGMHTPLLLPAVLGGVQRLGSMAVVREFLPRQKQHISVSEWDCACVPACDVGLLCALGTLQSTLTEPKPLWQCHTLHQRKVKSRMCLHTCTRTPPALFPCATFLSVAEIQNNCEPLQLADS